MSVATGTILPGSVGEGIAEKPADMNSSMSIEHPSGEFTVNLTVEEKDGQLDFKKSGVIRTARLISMGKVFIP